MKKRYFSLVFLFVFLLLLGGNADLRADSSFSIHFIDVGQGDSALVECDGHYMLIDGGDTSAGDKVYDVLKEHGIQHLDILAISHLHADHIGGLAKALTYASLIDLTISNSEEGKTEAFRNLQHELRINDSSITIPRVGEKYPLGSAEVEVIDVSSEQDNDSLVLLITFKNTRFLFTGDIGVDTQSRIANRYINDSDKPFKINLMKMPHHGGDVSILFIRTFMPDYAVISAGKGNQYGHPLNTTLDRLDQADVTLYRTDIDGDIIVKSNGEQLTFETGRY